MVAWWITQTPLRWIGGTSKWTPCLIWSVQTLGLGLRKRGGKVARTARKRAGCAAQGIDGWKTDGTDPYIMEYLDAKGIRPDA